jgi:hypothetical protein
VHIYFDKIDTLLLDNIQEELNEIKIIFNVDDFIMSMAGLNFQLNHIPKNELKKLIDYLKMININKLNPNKAIEDLTKQ